MSSKLNKIPKNKNLKFIEGTFVYKTDDDEFQTE